MFPPPSSGPLNSSQPRSLGSTLWISILILLCFFLSGGIATVVYIGWEFIKNPALQEHSKYAELVRNISQNGTVLALATLFSGSVGLGLVALAIRPRKHGPYRAYLNLKWPKWHEFLIWNGLLYLLLIFEGQLAQFFSKESDFLEEVITPRSSNLTLLYLAIVGMAPLFEEVFFRGFMFKGLERSRLGVWGTILVTSAIWAAIHVQYELFFIGIIFSLGLLLGYARHQTQSLWIPISMHMINNFLAMESTVAWLQSVFF